MTHRGMLVVYPEALAEILRLPTDSEIYGVEWDLMTRSVQIFIRHKDLPLCGEGEQAMRVTVDHPPSRWRV